MTSENTRELPDTVENAAATPGQDMPWKELGLKEDEYQRICDILGRRPTNAELAMYSVMWSEHCSYKSSKIHLKQFGQKVTPQMREHLLVGMGENAGVVDIGDGWAVTYKVESHNHPLLRGALPGCGRPVWAVLCATLSLWVPARWRLWTSCVLVRLTMKTPPAWFTAW